MKNKSFVLKRKYSTSGLLSIKKIDEIRGDETDYLAFAETGLDNEIYQQSKKVIIIIGDLVVGKNVKRSFELFYQAVKYNAVHEFGGFFYFIYIDNHRRIIKLWSSLFNILPIYYCKENNGVTISSRIDLILRFGDTKNHEIDKQYLLERVLFNYGLFNRTYLKAIKLVGANNYVEIGNNHFCEPSCLDIVDLFHSEFNKGQAVLTALSEKFIDLTEKYLPESNFAVSFTGGFDGRTLVAVSMNHQKDFFAYSFGAPESEDVSIPMVQSGKIPLEFKPIYLSGSYIENKSYDCGKDLITKTEGAASFARAHYVYAARILSEMTNYIITGNFGSELFRAMHNPGVMVSRELITFFDPRSNDNWKVALTCSKKLNFFRKDSIKNELYGVIEDLEGYKQSFKGLETNRFFYTYVLGEIFRKYFGPEIVMQQFFLTNRTPFLDFGFIVELFRSYYCGVYSDFFTNNPLKRYKGQLLYAYIIKKACPVLLSMKTGKGYPPEALLTLRGKLELLTNLITKKVKAARKGPEDPQAVYRAFLHNKNNWTKIDFFSGIYNEGYIRERFQRDRPKFDILSNVISSNYYLSAVYPNCIN